VRTPRFGRILRFPWARLQPPHGKPTAAGSSDSRYSHRTRKSSKHYIARRKLFCIFEESSYSAYAIIDSTIHN